MKVITASICFFLCINLGISQNNSFNGTFFNASIGLTIDLKENNGAFSGKFQFQGSTFPITAQLQDNQTVVGTYPYLGANVPIQLTKNGENYALISEGITIPMTFSKNNTANNQSDGKEYTSEAIKTTDSAKTIKNATNNKVSNRKANGKKITDLSAGYQFNLPVNWVGQKNEDGSYLIGHNTKPGFILVMPHNYTSIQQIYQETIGGIQDEGIQLIPSTDLTPYGKNGLLGNFNGFIEGQAVTANAVSLVSDYGGGLSILIAVRSDLYQATYLSIVQSIANSVVFSKPKTSAITQQWKTRLTGKKLQYLKTANGFSDKIVIDLCQSGQFGYNNNSSGMSGGTTTLTYAGQNQGQGTWKIVARGQQSLLILRFNNGEIYEYALTNRDSNGQINLDGRRYFMTTGGC